MRQQRSIELDDCRKSVQSMLLADRGMQEYEVCSVAVFIYAIARTVQGIRDNGALNPVPLIRMYLLEGLRGSTA